MTHSMHCNRKLKRENECDDLDPNNLSVKRMKMKNLEDDQTPQSDDENLLLRAPSVPPFTIPVKEHLLQSSHNDVEYQRFASQCNVPQANLVYVNEVYSTVQSNFKYLPDLNAVENPHYYENNRLLFELYVERVQRTGFQSFGSSHQSF